MAKMYYEKDCELSYLNGKKIAIIGYGSQGHAHALNLKDSGCDVCVGLRQGSKNWAKAEKAGLTVKTIPEAAKWGDIVMMLINDEVQAEVYKKDIAPYLDGGQRPGLRPRLQHPLSADRAPRRRGRVHGRPQGPRPHRPLHLCQRQGRALPGGRGAERHRQRL